MKLSLAPVLLLAVLSLTANAQWCPKYKVKIFLKTASYASGLKWTVNAFRAALGGVDNGNDAGPLAKGHRSINWDADVVPFNMPGNFFKVTVTRGAEFKAALGKFAVSNPPKDDPSGIIDNRFSSFNPKFPFLFRTFSPKRLFTPVVKNRYTSLFSVPAKGNKATVSGFGAVFTNVVKFGKTTMTFYDKNGCFIYKISVPARAKGLSFAGLIVVDYWGKPISKIAKVKVTLGNAPISSKYYKWKNFVVVDDLIYGEPQAIY